MWKETFDLYTDDLMSQNGCVPATGLAGHISHDTGRTRIERVVGFTVLPYCSTVSGVRSLTLPVTADGGRPHLAPFSDESLRIAGISLFIPSCQNTKICKLCVIVCTFILHLHCISGD